MGEWMAIAEWHRCAEMSRPGIVFEIRNAEGLRLVTRCAPDVPAPPWDWKSPGIEFRAIPEPKPEHSDPLPPPLGG